MKPMQRSLMMKRLMMFKIIKQEGGITRKISDTYSILNLLTAQDSDKISIAISTADNHKETTSTTSDRVYYILEGNININGEKAEQGDVVFIPANTEYTFKGTFKAILINSPPFKKENENIRK